MSLHAVTSKEAQDALATQKRNSTISSIVIALLTVFLVGLILFIISITIEKKVTPDLVPFGTQSTEDTDIDKPKMNTEVERKPSSPSSNMTRTIVANTTSSVSIPTVDVEITELSMDFGNGDDFGDGDDGSGFGGGSGGGAAGGFGATSKIRGTLGGIFYDFKQYRDGKPKRNYTVGKDADFVRCAKKFQSNRFSEKGLKQHYQAKKQLFVRYIAIPFDNADAAPRFFEVQDEVKPSGWMVHYKGKLRAPKTGRFRFVGLGDDYLSVAVDGKAKLIAAWPNIQRSLKRTGANARKQPHHKSPFSSQPLVYGSWFSLKQGQEFDVSIGIGENPGGKVGFLLMVEEEGATYRKGSDGRNVLPPFVFGNLVDEDKKQLSSFPGWEFELDNVPVFQAFE